MEITESIHHKFLEAIDADDLEAATSLVSSDTDLNIECSEIQGAPPLFLAILKGNVAMVQLLLDHGADPNYHANEPTATIYAERPLALARQARTVMSWDRYHPIVQVLENAGATD